MAYHPINFSLPGVGIIAVIGKRYETLTDEFIQEWLYDLVRDYLVTPDYLLVSAEVRHELYRIVMSDLHMHSWVAQNAQDERGEVAERYPNRITGKPLTMVVFPDLPEKTLFVASMLKMAHEEVQVRGSTHVVTRSYERL